MKKKMNRLMATLVPGFLALTLSGGALADWSWDFTGTYAEGVSYSSMTFSGSGGAPNVTATGWSNRTPALNAYSGSYGTGDLVQRQIARWDGIGVYSEEDGGSPTHATDNNSRIDSILLNFGGTAVTLDQVRFGWPKYNEYDTDFSISAYIGGGSTNLSSMEYSELTSNGWTTIGSYYNAGDNTTPVNSGEVSSSYWLISALNPFMDGPGDRVYYANDYFKLASVGGTGSTSVPEPSTLLLLGGMLLAGVVRRRIVAPVAGSTRLAA